MSEQDELLLTIYDIIAQKGSEWAWHDLAEAILAKAKQHYESLIEEASNRIETVTIQLKRLNKKLDDREEDLIEAKKQERERIVKWVEDTDILTMLSPRQRRSWQALKEEKKEENSG